MQNVSNPFQIIQIKNVLNPFCSRLKLEAEGNQRNGLFFFRAGQRGRYYKTVDRRQPYTYTIAHMPVGAFFAIGPYAAYIVKYQKAKRARKQVGIEFGRL